MATRSRLQKILELRLQRVEEEAPEDVLLLLPEAELEEGDGDEDGVAKTLSGIAESG